MKKHPLILAFTVILFTLQSCVNKITVPTGQSDVKLVFESDISTSEGYKARITTSTSFDDIGGTSFPEDLDVYIKWFNINDQNVALQFHKDCNCYKAESHQKPIPNREYTLEVYSPNNSDIYEDLTAKMTIPKKVKIGELKAVRDIQDDGLTEIKATIQFDDADAINPNGYFHILPYRKVTEKVDKDGAEELRYTGEIEYLEYIDCECPNNNITLLDHYLEPGFLVNYGEQDMSDNPLKVTLTTEDIIDYDVEDLKDVFYEVRSVTESYYRYQVYLSNKIEGEENSSNIPAIAFDNIKGGLGYFGGYTSIRDSIAVE